MLVYGNGERAIVEIAHRLSKGETIESINDVRGTAYFVDDLPNDWIVIDSSKVDKPGRIEEPVNPYQEPQDNTDSKCSDNAVEDGSNKEQVLRFVSREERQAERAGKRARTVLRLPSFDMVSNDKILYAHANRVLHLETNPGNARALVQNCLLYTSPSPRD